MIYLTHEELVYVAQRALGHPPEVRDDGLLEAAAARPQATAFGEEAYRDVHEKAAALLHSLARGRPLVDGNKRLTLAAVLAFYGMNGFRLTLTNDDAYALIMRVADGTLDEVGPIAEALRAGAAPRDGTGTQAST